MNQEYQYLGYTLFLALEREVTAFVRTELDAPELWPELCVSEAQDRMKSEPGSDFRDSHFVDYLYFQQKLEGVSINSERMQVVPKGHALLEKMPDLVRLNELRKKTAHARDLSQDELQTLIEICRYLVKGGFGGGEIGKKLENFQDSEFEGLNKTSNAPDIFDNLPIREYEDTGFIGRNNLISQVVKALKSESSVNSYIWLTGLGGFGKTAIAREVVDRLYWDSDRPFEVVIWLSFKTHELTTEGTTKIAASIASAVEALQDFPLWAGSQAGTLEELLNNIGTFKTLIVMDNCETYPGDMQELVDANPPSSLKFLFTSRSRGEFGRSIPVPSMNLKECRFFLSKLNVVYQSQDVSTLLRSDEDLEMTLQLIGMAPLGLKWLARACNQGQSLETVLANRSTLIRYCVENVYQGLSLDAKKVLHCLQLARVPLSVGDLKVLQSEMTADDLNSHISSLSRVGLVAPVNNGNRAVYVVDESAREFLVLTGLVDSKDSMALNRRMTKLRNKAVYKQTIESYSPVSIDGTEVEPLVCTELNQILKPERKQTLTKESLVDKTLELIESAPKFWEAYRVLGEVYSQQDDVERSIEYHELALVACPPERELSRSRLHYFLALQLFKVDEERAMTEARKAAELHECIKTLLCYARSLIYVRQYGLAESILDRATGFVESPIDAFYIEKFRFDCLRHKCEGLNGEDQLLGALAALKFWLESVELRWDYPRDKRSTIEDGVADSLIYLCEGYLGSKNTIEDHREEVVAVFLRIDSMMTIWEILDWPKLLQRGRRHGLINLSSVVSAEPKLKQVLGEKIDKSLTIHGLTGLVTISGTLKIWFADKGFGFVRARFGGQRIEAFFDRKSFRRHDDEAKVAFGKTVSISGKLHPGGDTGYFLSNVEVT